MSYTPGQEALIVNFDFVGSCRGSCPSCTLSEVERATPYAFLSGHQMVEALTGILSVGKKPDFLAIGLGRGNLLALDPVEHDSVVEMAAAARSLAPQAHRVIELSTSLIEAPARQRSNALSLMARVEAVDDKAECRLVVVLDASKKSEGYWSNITRFLGEMSRWRGGGDGSSDILAVNLSVSALPDHEFILSRIRGWKGPVNVQWLVSGEQVKVGDEELSRLSGWLAQFARLALVEGLDCNLVNVPQSTFTDYGGGTIHGISDQMTRLAWVSREAVIQRGAFTMLGDYAAATTVRPEDVALKMLKHPACRGCEHLRRCVRCGGFAPALQVMQRGHVSSGVCPSGLIGLFGGQFSG